MTRLRGKDGECGCVFAGSALRLWRAARPELDGLNAKKGIVCAGNRAGIFLSARDGACEETHCNQKKDFPHANLCEIWDAAIIRPSTRQASEPESSVAGAGLHGLLRQPFCELEAIAGEVVRGSVDALLQDATRVQGANEGFGVATKSFFALQLEVGGETAQAVHLVAHFAGSSFGGATEALVKSVHPFEQRGEIGVEGVACGGEFALAFDGHGACGEQLCQGVGIFGEDTVERELVLA